MYIRRSNSRGNVKYDWLNTYHSFSFGDYYDPQHRGFHHLRVINEDFIKGGAGFPPHPHQNMEIVTYMLDGALKHEDGLGNKFTLKAGEVQRMSAGSGIVHSEFNASETEEAHLLQIWIYPQEKGTHPSYQQMGFSTDDKKNKLKLLVSPSGQEKSLSIGSNVKIFGAVLSQNQTLEITLQKERAYWLQVARGRLQLEEEIFMSGDGVGIDRREGLLKCRALSENTEFLWFDLALHP